MSSFPRYIPWTPQLVCLLLNLVLTEGAHVAKKNEVLKKWNAVNEHFFNQNETQAWKTELYKKDDPRKLRDKYKLVMSTCKADIERDIEMKVQSSNRPNPLKKRDLDGNIVDLSDPTRKPKKDVFDEMLIEIVYLVYYSLYRFIISLTYI